MSEFKKGQAVIFTTPRGQEKHGNYVGEQDLGPGRGNGKYLVVTVEGKELRARPSKVKVA